MGLAGGVQNTRTKEEQKVSRVFIGMSEVVWLRFGLAPENSADSFNSD